MSTLDMGDSRGDDGRQARIVVVRGPAVGAICELQGDVLEVGRLPDKDFVLSSDTVSRHHATLRKDTRGWTIEDRKSHNGVLHNGYRIPPQTPVLLAHKDTLQLSDVVLLYLSGAYDHQQQQTISEIEIDIQKAEQEGKDAVDAFLKSVHRK